MFNEKKINDLFKGQMQKYLPFGNIKIALAVSGGADSMAMLLLSCKFAKKNNIKIIALTVDHALRSESATEALIVAKCAKDLNIEHHILKWEHNKPKANLQSLARDARYKLLTDYCKQHNIEYLLVAHHLDDQAETVLMRLMRGSGIDGLAAMDVLTNKNGIKIIRPLLAINKVDLVNYLKFHKCLWVEDPSNNNENFARVKVRKMLELFPDKEIFTERLAQTANHMQRARSFVNQEIDKVIAEIVQISDVGYILLDYFGYINLHYELQLRILSKLLSYISGNKYKVRFKELESLYSQICNYDNFKAATLYGVKISKISTKDISDIGTLLFSREEVAVEGDLPIKYGEDLIWDSRFVCNLLTDKKDLFIGHLSNEDIKKLPDDFLKNSRKKLKYDIIYTLPVLKDLEKPLVIPHIDYNIINDDWQNILTIKLKSF